MNNAKNMSNNKKIHFIGVGGVSVSALAEHAVYAGNDVSGSDICFSERIEKLQKIGCKIHLNHNAENVLNANQVVYTAAVKDDNAELQKAKQLNLNVMTRGEYLGKVLDEYKNSVAVSGCHGKTTTTAMIANVLVATKKDPTVFLGGDDYTFGNYREGKGDVIITEACEYNRSFFNLRPKIAVCLNIDNDHLDTYGTMEEIISAFKQFVLGGIAVINADDINCKKISTCATVTFGIDNKANYYATSLKEKDGCYSFVLNAHAKRYGRVKLKVVGKHNVYNALAAFAVCDMLGVYFGDMKKVLESFKGVKRRDEYIGRYNQVDFYADYAHHPKELECSIDAFNKKYKNYITVFQPHTYSRTEYLMKDFVKALSLSDTLIIYKTYAAREEYSENGSAIKLVEKIKEEKAEIVYYVEKVEDLMNIISINKKQSDKVVIFGAGDLYEDIKSLIVQKTEKNI